MPAASLESPEQPGRRRRSAQANPAGNSRCGFCQKPLVGVPVLVCVSESKEDKLACSVCQAECPWKAGAPVPPDPSSEDGAGAGASAGAGAAPEAKEDSGGCKLARSWRAARKCPRFRLVRMVFRECDVDRDCRLNMHELYDFAVETGFEEGPEVWQEEYEALCRKHGVHVEHGFHEAAFASLVDEGGHCQCSDEELTEVLSRLKSALWLRRPERLAASAPVPSQSTTEADATGGPAEPAASCDTSEDEALAQDHLNVGVLPVAEPPPPLAASPKATSKSEPAAIAGTESVGGEEAEEKPKAVGADVKAEAEEEKGGAEAQPWWRQQVERPAGSPAWPSKLLPSAASQGEPQQPESIESPAERVKATVRGLQRGEAERQLVAHCLDDLQSLVRTGLPRGAAGAAEGGGGWAVLPFGSAVSGFGAVGCDLDVVVVCPTTEKEASLREPASILTRLSNCLEGFAFELREVIPFARVPILKLSYRQGERELEVDISVNNWQGLRNTRLLQAYSGLDAKVSELGLAVKAWAKRLQVSGAPSGFLSSYALVLMVIYYLQVGVDGPRLPVLQEGSLTFESDGDVQECLKPHRQQQQPPFALKASLGELYEGFFQFYAKSFRWGEEVVSVRLGHRAASSRTQYQLLSRWHQSRLHIEDPFEISRNLNDVLFFTNEQRFLAALQEAAGLGTPAEPAAPVADLPAFRALRDSRLWHSMWSQASAVAGMPVPSYGLHGVPPLSRAPASQRRNRKARRPTKKVYPPGQRSEKESTGCRSKKDKGGLQAPGCS